jgi:predicted nucleotidyltransferase
MNKRPKIEISIDEIRRFCAKWKITEFSLLGSVLREDFRPGRDVDVLVRFKDDALWDLFDIVEMKEELKSIYGREVDLVEQAAIRNPFRRQSFLSSKETLYAA